MSDTFRKNDGVTFNLKSPRSCRSRHSALDRVEHEPGGAGGTLRDGTGDQVGDPGTVAKLDSRHPHEGDQALGEHASPHAEPQQHHGPRGRRVRRDAHPGETRPLCQLHRQD